MLRNSRHVYSSIYRSYHSKNGVSFNSAYFPTQDGHDIFQIPNLADHICFYAFLYIVGATDLFTGILVTAISKPVLDMSDTERQSPRAVIRNWLVHHHDNKGHLVPGTGHENRQDRHLRRRQASKDPLTVEKMAVTDTPREEEEHRVSKDECSVRKRQHPNATHEARSKLVKAQTYSSMEDQSSRRQRDQDLAKRLGLRAPFRTPGNDDDGRGIHAMDTYRPYKRKRSASSQSSYLQPAPTIELTGQPIDEKAIANRPKVSDRIQKPRKVDLPSPSKSHDVKDDFSSATKPLKSFERRPRHKTHEDRYKVKENLETKPKSRDRHAGRSSRMKTRPKGMTGAALLHDFTAKNVSNERLTV